MMASKRARARGSHRQTIMLALGLDLLATTERLASDFTGPRDHADCG